MKNGQTINTRKPGDDLYEILYTPKGEAEPITVYAYAPSRLEASNTMIRERIWGRQHEIRLHSSAAFLDK